MWDFPLFPDRASTIAGRVDAVFFYALAILVFFTAMICVLILFFAIKYRRGSRANREGAVTNNHTIEALWIGIPMVLALVLFAAGTAVYLELYEPPANASEIYILGRQWMWEARHPEGKRELNELHVPVGRPIVLKMISQDVIHSYFIPAFRIKQDVLPGRYTSLYFQATRPGKYHLFCAEYCGTKHSGMVGWVTVLEPSEYERWLSGGGNVAPSLVDEGSRLFQALGCSGCHGVNASVRAPLLDGVFGHPVPLESGGFVTADERYVRDSILLPKSQVVAGYKPVMPTFQGRINEDELLKIIAYIKALGKGTGR